MTMLEINPQYLAIDSPKKFFFVKLISKKYRLVSDDGIYTYYVWRNRVYAAGHKPNPRTTTAP